MIRLQKSVAPPVLVANGDTWRDEYLAALARGGEIPDSIRFRYRHPAIKAALRAEAYGKCVYCESKLPVGETDHIEPVTECPEKIVFWLNLCLACKECNTNKGSYYSVLEPLINPFIEDPGPHLLFFGPLVLPRAGNAKGFRTALRIKLSRTDLLQRRAERVQRLQPLVSQWISQPAGETKELLRQVLLDEASDSAEFAAVVRAYLYQELGWDL